MPDTPVTWLDSIIANFTADDNQSDPNILQLNNGNILVSWTSDYDGSGSTSSGSNAGLDIIGQIFSPLGVKVGDEILLSTAFTGDEGRRQADTGALPDGGFVVVYEDVKTGTREFPSLRLETFDAFGAPVNSSTVFEDNSENYTNVFNPNLAVGATTVMVVYESQFDDNEADIFFKIYTPATNTFSTEFFAAGSPNDEKDPSVAVLSNGNYVVVYTDKFGTGDSEIKMRIYDANGNSLKDETPVGQHVTNEPDSGAHVVGLTGGGFAVSWNNSDGTDNDVYVQIFNTIGNPVTGRLGVNDEGDTDVNSRSNIVDLPDGGFIVFYEDQETGNEGGRGQRFDSGGVLLGNSFMFNMTKAWDVEAVLLGDGRVALSYWDDEIKLHIVDSRDAANDPGVYTPDQYQIGTILDDTIDADAISEFVFAWDGNDTINESGQERQYSGGKGDDLLNVTSLIDSDVHDGGDDIDTIDWSGSSESGATFDLGNGTATNADASAAEAMLNFENFIGTENGETILGSDGANTIDGRGGNDTISGLAGDDSLMGGSGEDSIDGGDDNDTVAGGADNDTVMGSAGEDSLMGDAGEDSLDGGADNDTLDGGADNDMVFGGAGEDMVSGGDNDDMLSGGDDNDMLMGDGGADMLDGDAGDDSLMGGAGNDTLMGGTAGSGADTLAGGADDDLYMIEDSNDTVVEAAGEGTDRVETGMSYTLSANVENLTLTGSADLNGTGNAGDNTIRGNSGNNRLDGTTGTDTLIGGLGDDVYVTDGGDTVTETSGGGIDRVESSATVTLSDSVENLTLTGTDAIDGTGNTLANTIIGNNAANRLDGAGGIDTMMGGGGNDTYVTDGGDTITETADGGVDTVESSATHTLASNLENLTLLGSGNINGTGNELANMLIGNDGDNMLTGLGGADTMVGGAGDDTYVAEAGDTITEAAGEGTDRVMIATTYTLGANLENLTLTGTGNINGTGNALDNEILGTSGTNVLDGGAGDDTLRGGDGNDLYRVDSVGDVVDELLNEGIDTVESSVSHVLGANVENLTLLGTGAIDGTGNALNNAITGNAAANDLTGGEGSDTLSAGEGDNTILGDGGDDVITAGSGDDFIGGGAGNDVITVVAGNNRIFGGFGSDRVNGGAGNDTINGGGNSGNTLLGNDGDDVVVGGGGDDFLAGGAGNDQIFGVAGTNAIYTGLGSDTVQGGTGRDVVIGAGDGAKVLLGNGGSDDIRGGEGADLLGGGADNDTVLGNGGNDTIYGGGGNDLIGGGAGNDLLYGSVGNNTIFTGLGLDTVVGGSGNDIIYGGGTDAKAVYGNDGNDVVNGAGGNDLLAGGSGNDAVFGYDGDDLIFLGLGNDFVGGGAGNDAITAGAGDNTIYGGAGNDTINAGVGTDVMNGGPGADTFVFNSAAQAGIGVKRDVIADFVVGVDKIDLDSMNLTFIGNAPFSGGAQLAYLTNAAAGFLVGDINGDAIADFVIEVTGAPAITAGDLIL